MSFGYNQPVRTDGCSSWSSAPSHPALGNNEVHVWRLIFHSAEPLAGRLETFLSPDEREKARAFYFEDLRSHYRLSHGALRCLLGFYTASLPVHIQISTRPGGKPYLSGSDLRFNLSHTRRMALLAFSRGRELGIDVEAIRDLPDALAIADRFFSRSEQMALSGISDAERGSVFFNSWTRKEAYIKALGEGLSHPLDTFDVSLLPGEPARLVAVHPAPIAAQIQSGSNELERWQFAALEPGEGHVAALVVEGRGWSLRCFDAMEFLIRTFSTLKEEG